MKYIIFASIYFASTLASAGGQIPFLFMPKPSGIVQIILGSPLVWYGWGTYEYYNGELTDFVNPGPRTFTIENKGSEFSGMIMMGMSSHNGAFSFSNDGCSYAMLLPGGTCEVEITSNGFAEVPAVVKVTAYQDNTTDEYYIYIKYCPEC